LEENAEIFFLGLKEQSLIINSDEIAQALVNTMIYLLG
jgi:hypothetical protein